jgi:hypothetical protein
MTCKGLTIDSFPVLDCVTFVTRFDTSIGFLKLVLEIDAVARP